MCQPLGIGFLGAGPVTQAIHLPTLARIGDLSRQPHQRHRSRDSGFRGGAGRIASLYLPGRAA